MTIKTLGKQLKQLREKAGLSRNALAAQAGIDPTYYGRLEDGKIANPSFNVVISLANILQVSIDSLAKSAKP